jgi:glycosyltransferase involved in cell wall biosynthesis
MLDANWITHTQFLMSHDVPVPPPEDLKCNKLVCLSDWHLSSWNLVDNSIAEIIGNGVDLRLFDGAELTRNENVLLWTSNPDRGLPLAAKIFSEHILPRWPELELHVYGRSSVYGWPAEMEGPYIPRVEHLDNVFIHEPLNKAGLAKALREAWAWFYPTYWGETYCIAALEAQAAGTPCITVPLGALDETVKGGILSYDFVNSISQLRNKNRWNKLSAAGKEFAADKDWDDRADQWIEMIKAHMPPGVPGV